MELPKLKNENLPEELKKILGEDDAEFDAIVDPMDIFDIHFDKESYEKGRQETAEMFVQARKKLQEYRQEEKNQNQVSE
jgi:hypothetical protein